MIKKLLLYIAIIFVSVQIFNASSQVATESAEMSGKITKKVVDVIAKVKKVEPEKKEDLFNSVHLVIRKTAHFAEYALLTLLVFLLTKCYKLKNFWCFLISLGYCIIFAASDEIHQLFVSGRSGEIRDVILDFCGGITGSVFGFLACKITSGKKAQ